MGRSQEGAHLIVTAKDLKTTLTPERPEANVDPTQCPHLPWPEREEGEESPLPRELRGQGRGTTAPTGAPPGVSEGTPTGSSKCELIDRSTEPGLLCLCEGENSPPAGRLLCGLPPEGEAQPTPAPGAPRIPPRPKHPALGTGAFPDGYCLPASMGKDFRLETDGKRISHRGEKVGEADGIPRCFRWPAAQAWTNV